ncbi:MAG: sugar nucleotide-binding protein [Actinobacteria bacterium]|nr:sugar nucleotide-binding protein [Actinomycetota bacterium]
MATGPHRTSTVLVTGASGLLGGALLATVPDDVEAVAVTHRSPVTGDGRTVAADLRDPAATLDAVAAVRPSVVIHAAYTVDEASIVDATRNVAAAAAAVGATVVLTSTDAVFAGDGRPRTEDDVPDPVADYGRWKAAAEQLVTTLVPDAAVVRLPLLTSVDPEDHVARQIRAAVDEGRTTPWFTDEIRRPAMVAEVAEALWRIVALPPAERAGPWHLAGPVRMSRYEIAERLLPHLGLPDTVIEGNPTPPGSTRPKDLELTDERARAAIAWNPTPILR